MQIANRTRSKRAEKLACIQAAMVSLDGTCTIHKRWQQGKQAALLRVNGARPLSGWELGGGILETPQLVEWEKTEVKCSRPEGLYAPLTREGCVCLRGL
jgi:hypothetical protein